MAYEMWAWVVDDFDGKEGICTIRRSLADGGQELLCLHHRDRDEAEAMRPLAELQTTTWGRPVRLVHLREVPEES